MRTRHWPLVVAAFATSIVIDYQGGFWSWQGFVGVLVGLGFLTRWILGGSKHEVEMRWLLVAWLIIEASSTLSLLLNFDIILSTPSIDVYEYQTQAAERLLRGEELNGADYHVATDAQHPDASENYPYMPFEAILRAASLWAFGDVRWIGILLLTATTPLTYLLARRSFSVLDSTLVSATILFVGTPLYIIHLAWTEPLVPFFFALGLVLFGRSWVGAGIALGLTAALKLYLLILVPMAWSMDRRTGVVAAVTAGLTVLPFALQDWHGLLHGSLLFHFTVPPRTDGVNLTHLWIGWPTLVGAVAWLVCAAWLALRLLAARAPVVAVVGLLALFLAGRQGHPNYWWLLPPLLLMAWELNASNRLISGRSTGEPARKGEANDMARYGIQNRHNGMMVFGCYQTFDEAAGILLAQGLNSTDFGIAECDHKGEPIRMVA